MGLKLTAGEIRGLGVLMEKAVTTPDQYPLSLNALTTGCNQKTNREPVMELSESEVQRLLDSLVEKRLVSEVRVGSRVAKYQHRFSGTEFSQYPFNKQQQAVLCLLFLRGPQTPGELRSRSNRLCDFCNVEQVELVLNGLIDKDFVQQMAREPGRRELRYQHLFGEHDPLVTNASAVEVSLPTMDQPQNLEQRVSHLETVVEQLQKQVQELTELLN